MFIESIKSKKIISVFIEKYNLSKDQRELLTMPLSFKFYKKPHLFNNASPPPPRGGGTVDLGWPQLLLFLQYQINFNFYCLPRGLTNFICWISVWWWHNNFNITLFLFFIHITYLVIIYWVVLSPTPHSWGARNHSKNPTCGLLKIE